MVWRSHDREPGEGSARSGRTLLGVAGLGAAALVLGAALVAFGRPQPAEPPPPSRSVAQLEQSVMRALRERGLVAVTHPMCMRRSLDQKQVPLPSFGWSCELEVKADGRRARLMLPTVNVGADGCWRSRAQAPAAGIDADDEFAGCLRKTEASSMGSMSH